MSTEGLQADYSLQRHIWGALHQVFRIYGAFGKSNSMSDDDILFLFPFKTTQFL